MIKPRIKHTWICSPWCVHRRDKWWSQIKWSMMLSWSWWWRSPSSFAFQLIALFLYRYLFVFIQKLLKGRLDPIFCTTRLPRFRPVRPVWRTGQTSPVRPDMVALILPPSRSWTLFSYIIWSMVSIGDNLSNRTSRCFFNGHIFLSCVKSEFLFNRPSFLTR